MPKKQRGRPKKREEKAIIIDFAGIVPKARFINNAERPFRGSDLDSAYKAMRKGMIVYKAKLKARLEAKEQENG